MKIQKSVDVYLKRKRTTRPIEIVQTNTGIQLVFNMMDFEIPDNTTATLYVQKPSGKFVYQDEDVTVTNNAVTIDLENQATTEAGKAFYQVMLVNGEDTISTFAGLMIVSVSLADEGAEKSTTVIRAFDEAVSERIAEFQANAETIIAALIETIPEDYTELSAKVNEFANAIKSTATGEIVVMTDVSPVEHEPVVCVHGKNMIPLPYSEDTLTRDGITFTVNDDGGLNISGTAEQNTSFNLAMQYKKTLYVKKGRAYTISVDSSLTSTTGYVYYQVWKDGVASLSKSIRQGSATFTPEKDGYMQIGIVLLSDQTYSETVYIWLEEGEEATDYAVYTDPTTMTVRRCGKNLLPYPYEVGTKTSNGITYTDNGDGSVTIDGTATDTGSSFMLIAIEAGKRMFLPKGTYTFACPEIANADVYCNLFYYADNETSEYEGYVTKNNTFTLEEGKYVGAYFRVYEGATLSSLRMHPQLEVGSSATDFEAYSGAEYIPSSDGTVAGVISLSPNMTILTDTAGVTVDCEYNVDTMAYLNTPRNVLLQDTVTGKIYELKITDGHVIAEGVTS